MKVKRKTINKGNIHYRNEDNKRTAQFYIDKALQYKTDPDKVKRLEEQLCKCCFYINNSRIGGNAITTTECAICGKEMVFPNTSVDALCEACAKENGLCKHCIADIELINRRKDYPFEIKGIIP